MLIIDTHCHAGRNWFEPIETLEFQMSQNGVDGAVLIQHGGTYDNEYLFEAAARRPGRFKVVVLVDPEDEDPLGRLTRLSERGAAGVRLYPGTTFVHAGTADIWRKAGELGMVVSTMSSSAEFADDGFSDLLDACPDTAVVIEHLAGASYSDAPFTEYEKNLRHAQRPNTSIKVPGLGEIAPRSPRLAADCHFDDVPPLFEMARDAFGPRRMMWGSDFPPCAGREGYANALNGVRNHQAFAAGDDLEWVLGRTAAKIWGFDLNT